MKLLLPSMVTLARSFALSLFFPLLAFAGFIADMPAGSQLTNPLQQIVFSSDDYYSAVLFELDKRVLLINGVDHTELTTVNVNWNGSCKITYAPTTNNPMPQGNVVINLTIPYNKTMFWDFENLKQETYLVKVFVDSLSPEIKRISPAEGKTITDLETQLIFSILDTGIGVDSDSIKILINDVDKSEFMSFSNGELVYTPTSDNLLPDETFQLTVIAADSLGNKSQVSFEMIVNTNVSLSAKPIAIPRTAYAPVTIRFAPKVTTNNAIQIYQWDFNGDGVYDSSDIIGNTYTHQYTTPGDYTVTLRVRDRVGDIATGSVIVHILNKAPVVSAEASPSNGEIPLVVTFSVTASDNEGISKFEWDFDGDGTYDYNSTTTGNTSYTYTDTGQYNASLRVTDGLGKTSIYTLPTTNVNAAPPGSPMVTATTDIAKGDVPLVVTLDASATDPQGHSFTLWEWDFDSDGTYDYSSSQNASVSHTYDAAGTYYPRVRVTTDDDRTCTDVVEVKVANVLSLARDIDTLDIALNQRATITTILGGKTEVQIVIEDKNMNVVQTLVDWIKRPGGTYQDTWDGLAADSSIVPEGDYYAVLNYKEEGQVKRIDLRESRDTSRYIPSRSNAARYFAPFDNDPMRITFNLPYSSEVTAFIGYSYSNSFLVTFMNRQPLGKGSHTVLWYGTNNEGVLIKAPPGRYFMFGVWAYRLANNAIYVKSGAHIQSLIAQPSVYNPIGHEENGLMAKSRIKFTLTADASVELLVTDAQSGTLAASLIYPDLKAGANTIEWDGRNGAGNLLAPGKYRIGIRAISANGYRSLIEYTLQRIYY